MLFLNSTTLVNGGSKTTKDSGYLLSLTHRVVEGLGIEIPGIKRNV